MIVASFYAPRFEKWKNVNYDELLILVDKSCKKLNLKHIVISDAFRPAPLETFVCDLPENLMQAIICGQMKLMEKAKEPVLLIGADCLLTRDVGDFGSDIAITLSSTFSDCVMNTGMVWVGNGEKCGQIWQKVLDKEPKEWGEDQTFLYEAILDSDLNVEKLTCEEYNWAPEHVDDNAGMPVVVHFRGRRKKFMKEWAKSFLDIE